MQFLSLVALTATAAVATASTIEIGYPTPGATLKVGPNIQAQIIRPNSIEGCIEVGIALGVNSCTNGVCPSPADQIGAVLYSGSYNPTGKLEGAEFENFTVVVPEFLAPGEAIFTLTHLCLIGAGPHPMLEYRNVTVNLEH
ncbi:hypothetical protein HYDPIDRAFT_120694 [Hydnomerulius pinastri MD-312]|nr:hypothetical protein HYDPIDRAFT_120694 [Hydnomerulius pinastri MD-312]